MLDENYLKNFLSQKGIKAEVVKFQNPVITSEDVRNLLGEVKVVKTVMLMADSKPIICILLGRDRIDLERIKEIENVKEVRLAKAKEVKEISGYDIGALPPFAHKQKIETLIDEKLKEIKGIVYCGGGSHYSLLKIEINELFKAIPYANFKRISS